MPAVAPSSTATSAAGGEARQIHLDTEAFPSSVAGTVARATEMAGQASGAVAYAVSGLMSGGMDPLSAAIGAITGSWSGDSVAYHAAVAGGGAHVQSASSATVGGLTSADAAGAADIASVPVRSV